MEHLFAIQPTILPATLLQFIGASESVTAECVDATAAPAGKQIKIEKLGLKVPQQQLLVQSCRRK